MRRRDSLLLLLRGITRDRRRGASGGGGSAERRLPRNEASVKGAARPAGAAPAAGPAAALAAAGVVAAASQEQHSARASLRPEDSHEREVGKVSVEALRAATGGVRLKGHPHSSSVVGCPGSRSRGATWSMRNITGSLHTDR